MITLNQIAYNIQNMMYPKSLLDPQREGQITLRQIKFWIHYHRARLIQENVSKGILNYTNLYQNVQRDAFFPANEYNNQSVITSQINNTFYGLELTKTQQNKEDSRNLGVMVVSIPEIVSLPNNAAIKNVALHRRLKLASGPTTSGIENASEEIAIYEKNNSDIKFGNFNKFTKNNKPFYEVMRKQNIEDSSSSNGGLIIALHSLQISPNNLQDTTSTAVDTVGWVYRPSFHIICQDPTQINNMQGLNNNFDDETSTYPIPAEYVKDLIERVLQTEGSVSLKTLQSEL